MNERNELATKSHCLVDKDLMPGTGLRRCFFSWNLVLLGKSSVTLVLKYLDTVLALTFGLYIGSSCATVFLRVTELSMDVLATVLLSMDSFSMFEMLVISYNLSTNTGSIIHTGGFSYI